MKKVMRVIKEAHNTERKRRKTSRQNKREETTRMIQRAKSLISEVKRGRMRKEKIEEKLDEIFGKGSHQEIESVTTIEKIVERIAEMAKREEQFEKWETMR